MMLNERHAIKSTPHTGFTRPAEPHPDLLPRLQAILGDEGLITDPNAQLPHLSDWLGRWQGRAALIVRPANTAQTAAVMRVCHSTHTPVVTQGGNTGLNGGAVPDSTGAQVILNMGRMNRIRDINTLHNTLVAEAGVLLAQVQQAALDKDRFFPLSLGSESDCTIGGNLATNAGGIAVQRYGDMRDLALGLEVVLPDGQIWNSLYDRRKDNSGYDLCQLLIGSEGTLGVITAAALKLLPRPATQATAWVSATRLEPLIHLLMKLRERCGDRLAVFDLMSDSAVSIATAHVPGTQVPLLGRYGFHALIEMSDTYVSDLHRQLQDTLTDSLQSSLIGEATVSATDAQARALRRLRQCVSQAQLRVGPALRYNICLPPAGMPDFLAHTDASIKRINPHLQSVFFGPLGGERFHYNLLLRSEDPQTLLQEESAEIVDRLVRERTEQANGSVSTDHGFWSEHHKGLPAHKSPIEQELMMRIKQALDPNHLMNPGKLLWAPNT